MSTSKRWAFAVWTLLIGLWLGTVVANFYAAQVIFDNVGSGVSDSSAAGSMAGGVFAIQGRIGLAAMLVGIPLWLFVSAGGTGRGRTAVASLLAAALLLMLVEMLWITPEIRALREELGSLFGSVSDAPKEHPLRRRFGMLHGLSAVRALLEAVVGAIALLIATAGMMARGSGES